MVYNKNELAIKIQETAESFIFSKGVRGWNMDEFAAEVGVTKRTLYRYVSSKEELLKSFLLSYIKDIQNRLVIRLSGVKSIESGIEVIVDNYPKMITKLDSKVIREIFLKYPATEKMVVTQIENVTEFIEGFIKRGQNDGVIDEKLEPTIILESIQALIIYHTKNNPDKFEQRLRASISMLVDGILKKEV